MSENKNILLRQIPKVDELLAHEILSPLEPAALLTQAIRDVLDGLRNDILQNKISEIPCHDTLTVAIADKFSQYTKPKLRRVINGTGIILHTNLGRAPLAKEAMDAIHDAARDYSNLEYCTDTGRRSSRHAHIEDLLIRLTGAEAAMVVNNNAAAVLLALSAMAHGKNVIVSRGELVEIGGSFRVPDVLAQSGCRLVEVGTTNKTHTYDYTNAIDPYRTGALLRVHTSNFIITGFVAKPDLEELADIAGKHSIPLIEDLGSGCMIPLAPYGIHGQPVVSDSIKAGVDIVTFSGDKLLGGPQAGIVVGRAEYIAKMKTHPLARAMRIDKLCLAALEATLRLYLDPETAVARIPTLRMLCETPERLLKKAHLLKKQLDGTCEGDILSPVSDSLQSATPAIDVSVITDSSQAGGGAMPEENLATAAVVISANISAQTLERHFRSGPVPIIGRISRDRFMLDVRTIDTNDFPLIAARLHEAYQCEVSA